MMGTIDEHPLPSGNGAGYTKQQVQNPIHAVVTVGGAICSPPRIEGAGIFPAIRLLVE
jgi:hypothetical protein